MRTFVFTRLSWLAVLGFAVLCAPVAHADTVYTLTDNGCITNGNPSGCGTAPYGTVDLAQDGTGVLVTVTLASGVEFDKTGAGAALEFDISGDPAVTIADISTGFASNGADTATPYGSFDQSLVCTNCKQNQGVTPNPGPLSFLVTLSGGGTLTPSMFTSTAYDDGKAGTVGVYFTADVIDSDGTGSVGAFGPGVVTPEPATVALFAIGLLTVAGLRKRLLANRS